MRVARGICAALAGLMLAATGSTSAAAQTEPNHSDVEFWPGVEFTKAVGQRSTVVLGLWPLMFNRNATRLQEGEAYVGTTYRATSRLIFGGSYRYVYYQPSSRISSTEHRWSGDVTLRVPIKSWITISDRNRSESRFIDGRFSQRYANRLQLERAFSLHDRSLCPYVAFEPLYSTRSGRWNKKRYFAGVVIQLTPHSVLDLFYLRETDPLANPGDLYVVSPVLRLRF